MKLHTDLESPNSFSGATELNVNKTKKMLMDFKKKETEIMPLKINDKIIEQVTTYTYIGVTIDEKLHWSDHIKNNKTKANKRLYSVRNWVRLT